jgi:hypothetical protein
MSRSYRAVLHDNRIEWVDPPPTLFGPTLVEINFFYSDSDEDLPNRASDAARQLPGRDDD